MKAFRVRDAGKVENAISWKLLDGTAFVMVGGSSRPYLTVAPALVPADQREGEVVDCGFVVDEIGGMMLVPPSVEPDLRALIVVPSGGFDFRVRPDQTPEGVRFGNAARVVLLAPGDFVEAYPHVRTIAESERARLMRLTFDGTQVRFAVA